MYCHILLPRTWEQLTLLNFFFQIIIKLIQICCTSTSPWWRHQMETFCALLALFAGNSPVTGEFPAQRPVTRSFDVFFDLRLNNRLSKQSWDWWFETPSRSSWRHCNVTHVNNMWTSVSGRSTPHSWKYTTFVRGVHWSRWIPSQRASNES